MVMMLDVLSEYLRRKGYRHQRLDGSTRNDLRKHAMDHFNAEGSEDFCFLLSTRAGGLGINLATADTVIIFDSDWNPQNDLQAMARAHRIGQKRQVSVFRFVTKGTVEEDILEKARQKRVLDTLVIQQMDTRGREQEGGLFNQRRKSSSNTPDFKKEDMDRIIKFGAMELFKDDGGAGGAEGADSVDLDEILRRAEKHDTAEGAAQGAGEELLSQFKTVDIAVDMEEPSWDAIIPEEDRRREEERAETARLKSLQLGPRKRTAVRYAGADAEAESQAASSTAPARRKAGGGGGGSGGGGSKDATVPELVEAGLGEFTVGTMKLFMAAIRKHGATAAQLPLVIQDAGLQGSDPAAVARLAAWVRQGAVAAEVREREAEAKASPKPADGDGKAKAKKQAAWSVAGRPYNPTELLARLDGLAALRRVLRGGGDAFRLPPGVKMPVGWDVRWSAQTDALLLRGVHAHGFGAWEAMKADEALKGLQAALLPADPAKKPQRQHLEKRAQTLLKHLIAASAETTAARKGGGGGGLGGKGGSAVGNGGGKPKQQKTLQFVTGGGKKQKGPAAAVPTPGSSAADVKAAVKKRAETCMRPVARELQRMAGMADANPAKLDLLYTVGQHIRQEVARADESAQAALTEALWTHTHHKSGFKDWTPKLLRSVFKTLRKERRSPVQPRKGGPSRPTAAMEPPRAPKRKEGDGHRHQGMSSQAGGAKRPRQGEGAFATPRPGGGGKRPPPYEASSAAAPQHKRSRDSEDRGGGDGPPRHPSSSSSSSRGSGSQRSSTSSRR